MNNGYPFGPPPMPPLLSGNYPPNALVPNPIPIAPNLTFDAEPRTAESPRTIEQMMGVTGDLSQTARERGRNRSIQFTPVEFGPGLATHAQIGLYQDDSDEEFNRNLDIQCDAVDLLDAQGGPLFVTATIDSGANGNSLRNIIDIVPGSIVRVPVTGSKTAITGRIFKPFPSGTPNEIFNGPGATQEGFPVNAFRMRAFIVTGVAYSSDYFAKPQRKLQNLAPGAGTFDAPIAWGTTSVAVIGDAASLTFRILTSDGLSFGPFAANSVQPVYLPQNAKRIEVANSAVGNKPFEIQYYIGL